MTGLKRYPAKSRPVVGFAGLDLNSYLARLHFSIDDQHNRRIMTEVMLKIDFLEKTAGPFDYFPHKVHAFALYREIGSGPQGSTRLVCDRRSLLGKLFRC